MLPIKSRIRRRMTPILTGTVLKCIDGVYAIDWDNPDLAKKLLGYGWGLVEQNEVDVVEHGGKKL